MSFGEDAAKMVELHPRHGAGRKRLRAAGEWYPSRNEKKWLLKMSGAYDD